MGIGVHDEPLGVTDTHPIWSETRQDFVVAGQLEIGEQFRTVTGQSATLTKIHPHRGPPEMVFNLEVDGQHVYHVARNGLLVHNDCPRIIFRGGGTSPSNLTPRDIDEGMLSFRDSLSNPIDPNVAGPLGGRPVFPIGGEYIEVDANQLPIGSVVPDNVPPGHVSVVNATVDQIKRAVLRKAKLPKH